MASELAPSGTASLPDYDADLAATDYLLTRGWLYADRFAEGASDGATFSDEAALWAAALHDQGFYETRALTLQDVVLTDWIPRSPGRYHTQSAEIARDEAQHRILERTDDHVVYAADGKTNMVEGGVGCLRLAVKTIGGERIKFLGATSSGVVHRGFVVALSLGQYETVADFIAANGGVRCTVSGRIRFWSGDETAYFFDAGSVPRAYLGVDELRKGSRPPTDLPRLDVTPAVTFLVDEAGNRRQFFTYTHFDPADPGHISQAVEWMNHYVVDRYHGRVIGDFDDLVARFDKAVVPLTTLMDGEVTWETTRTMLTPFVSERSLTVVNNYYGRVVMGDSYEVSGGQVGAFGPGATASDFVQNQQINLEVLAGELGQLRAALRERGTDAEHDRAVGEVAAAEVAAKEGDAEGALRHLKQAGRWALDVATQIGIPVAVAALQSVL